MFKEYYQSTYLLKDSSEQETAEAILLMNGLRSSFYEDTDEKKTYVYVYSDSEEEALEAERVISEKVKMILLLKRHERIDEKDYLLKYIDNYQPITVARFRVIPYFHKLEKDENYIDIHLNPGYSFGTGEHATTQLVLEHISEMDLGGKRILDVGTGSGILSIAAEKCGASLVVGFDFDESTPEAAGDNYDLNGLKNTFFINSYDDCLKKGTVFDLILINMLSREFKPIFCGLIGSFADKNTEIILSGFLEEEEADIGDFVKKNGMKVGKRICSREWASYRLLHS